MIMIWSDICLPHAPHFLICFILWSTLLAYLTLVSYVVFVQEQQKYAQLMEIIKKLDEEKKRGDSLLYAMIPKAVADRLRRGITALETCQVQDVTNTHEIERTHGQAGMYADK